MRKTMKSVTRFFRRVVNLAPVRKRETTSDGNRHSGVPGVGAEAFMNNAG